MFASHRFTKKGDWCRRGRATTCSVSHSAAQGTEMNRLWSFGGKRVGNAQLVSVGALAKIGRLLDKFGQTIIFDGSALSLMSNSKNHTSFSHLSLFHDSTKGFAFQEAEKFPLYPSRDYVVRTVSRCAVHA